MITDKEIKFMDTDVLGLRVYYNEDMGCCVEFKTEKLFRRYVERSEAHDPYASSAVDNWLFYSGLNRIDFFESELFGSSNIRYGREINIVRGSLGVDENDKVVIAENNRGGRRVIYFKDQFASKTAKDIVDVLSKNAYLFESNEKISVLSEDVSLLPKMSATPALLVKNGKTYFVSKSIKRKNKSNSGGVDKKGDFSYDYYLKEIEYDDFKDRLDFLEKNKALYFARRALYGSKSLSAAVNTNEILSPNEYNDIWLTLTDDLTLRKNNKQIEEKKKANRMKI